MREFNDGSGSRWRVEVVSRGRTSDYLNARVHRPILQFTCLGRRTPRRYVGCPGGVEILEGLSDVELDELLGRAQVH